MAKGVVVKSMDNSFGTASVVLGIFSIMLSSPPLYGLVLGVISFIFSTKQQKKFKNGWSKSGKILSIIGIILSIVFWIVLLWLQKNPEIYNQLLQGGLSNAQIRQ